MIRLPVKIAGFGLHDNVWKSPQTLDVACLAALPSTCRFKSQLTADIISCFSNKHPKAV